MYSSELGMIRVFRKLHIFCELGCKIVFLYILNFTLKKNRYFFCFIMVYIFLRLLFIFDILFYKFKSYKNL